MPLCSTPQPDILIWPKEKSRSYSIKLGYKALSESLTHAMVRPETFGAQKIF